MKNLNDYIITIDNAITNELCDAVLGEYKDCADWVAATTAANKADEERQCDAIGISFDIIIQKNLTVRKNLDTYLYASASYALEQYKERFSLCKVDEDTGYELLRYKQGQFYLTHTDSFVGCNRAISCSFALNDDYEGGEFAFFDRELVYKLKKGSCIIFPSNFMYPHEIMPVTSGTRYSIVTWFR